MHFVIILIQIQSFIYIDTKHSRSRWIYRLAHFRWINKRSRQINSRRFVFNEHSMEMYANLQASHCMSYNSPVWYYLAVMVCRCLCCAEQAFSVVFWWVYNLCIALGLCVIPIHVNDQYRVFNCGSRAHAQRVPSSKSSAISLLCSLLLSL